MSDYKNIRTKEKLEKCPFCGSEAAIYDFVDKDGPHGIGDVCCSKAHPLKDGVPCSMKIFHYSGKCGRSKKQAIKNWNDYCNNEKHFADLPNFDSEATYII